MTNISFISGTRADYGKIKPYIDFLCNQENKKVFVFTTGMNMLKKYGSTYKFIKSDLKKKCIVRTDKKFKPTSTALETAHILKTYDKHLKKDKIDFIFVHGYSWNSKSVRVPFHHLPEGVQRARCLS